MAFKIEHIWAFISVDEEGEDGIVAFNHGHMWEPLIAADEARLNSGMRERAQLIADVSGKAVKLVRFSVREELEITDGKEWRPVPHE